MITLYLENKKGPKKSPSEITSDFKTDLKKDNLITSTENTNVQSSVFYKSGFMPIDIIKELPRHKTRKWKKRSIESIEGGVYHHSQTDKETTTVTGIAKYHVAAGKQNHISKKGCPGICYTYVIDGKGKTYQTNELTDITWHARGANAGWLAILVIGDYSVGDYKGKNTLSSDQKDAIRRLNKFLRNFVASNLKFKPHSKYGKPACPGLEIEYLVKAT